MKFYKLNSDQKIDSLRALLMVANSADGGISRPQSAILQAIQQCLFHTEQSLADLTPITVDELCDRFPDASVAKQLIQQMIIVSLADGIPSRAQSDLISEIAKRLKVKEPAVKVIRNLMLGNRLHFRIGFYLRCHIRDYLATQYRTQGGLTGVIKGLLGVRGFIENPPLANRFYALEKLAKNTLGYQFFDHYRKNGLKFPGEKGGFPVGALFHDFGHVLAGCDTSSEGEILAASFQAGFRHSENAFFVMLFALLTHTSGVNMTPFEVPPETGRIGKQSLANGMFTAWLAGTTATTDLGDDWDFWSYLESPIDVVREQIGVINLPEQMAAAYDDCHAA